MQQHYQEVMFHFMPLKTWLMDFSILDCWQTYRSRLIQFYLYIWLPWSHKMFNGIMDIPEHTTLTSSLLVQLFFSQDFAGHSLRADSVPLHLRSSSQMCVSPLPYIIGLDFGSPHPNCRHTTLASSMPQPWSQTLLHCLLYNFTSTLPLQRCGPFTSLRSTMVSESEAVPRQAKFQRVVKVVKFQRASKRLGVGEQTEINLDKAEVILVS